MRIVVLAGGIGGARFLRGVRALARSIDAEVTAIVNVGDDVTLHGLHICPDLDSVMYTLGGGADPERGWGRAGETWAVKEELAAYGAEPAWFGLGDRDVATHLVRTRMLGDGHPLSSVTQALCEVCAVAEDEVRAAACRLPGQPAIVNLEPQRLGEVFDAIRQVADAASVADRAPAVIDRLRARVDRVGLGFCGSVCAGCS